jgi:hypothetical protein
MLKGELDDQYFGTIQDHLRRLKFREGILISAGLGNGNTGTDYVLRKASARSWWRRTLCHTRQDWVSQIAPPIQPVYTFHIHPRDEADGQALAQLRDRGVNLVANALAQSTDHILSFFAAARRIGILRRLPESRRPAREEARTDLFSRAFDRRNTPTLLSRLIRRLT